MNGKKIFFYRSITLLMLILVLFFSNNQVQGNAADLSRQEDGSCEAIDAYIEKQLKTLNVPGASLVIIEGDQIVHTKGFGITGLGEKSPTPQTPFFIGSLTKSFTALAVMQLVEAGKINLDAPLQDYLPWFRLADPQIAAQISVRHLLIQTSSLSQIPGMLGLANFDNSANATEQQARELVDLEPARQAGETFEYSNVNYNLLGLIIEAVSGETYADYIRNHIFDPLGMEHSYVSKNEAQADDLAVGYQEWFGFPVAVPDLPVPLGSLPSGQLIASAEDMAFYLIAQLNGGQYAEEKILSAAGMDQMHQAAASTSEGGISLGGDYGMGWFVTETEQGRRIWHYGEVPDFYAYMAILPEQEKGLALLVNTNHQMYTYALLSAAEGAVNLLAGVEPQANIWGLLPWILRLTWLIPLIQILFIVDSLRQSKIRRELGESRKKKIGVRIIHSILPGIMNLVLLVSAAALLLSGMMRFMLLFMGDITLVLLVSGVFALIWITMMLWFSYRYYRLSREFH